MCNAHTCTLHMLILALVRSNDNRVRKAEPKFPFNANIHTVRERARCEIDYPNCIVRRKTVL